MALTKNSKILASDVSGAIKSITRSGTTFTYTTLGGTTGTFTQQDNNTTYSAGTGISISSNKISNTGVTSVNGQTGAVTVSAGNATTLANCVMGGYEFGESGQFSGGSVDRYNVTLPSGGTWRYVLIGSYTATTCSGGTTIGCNGKYIVAIRIA